MITGGEVFLKILREVFSKPVLSGNTFKQAYQKLVPTKLARIGINTKGAITFNPDLNENPNLVVDMLSNLTINKFVEWGDFDNSKRSPKQERLQGNLLDILECAWKLDKEKVDHLIAVTMSTPGSNQAAAFLRKIGGIRQIGNSES